MINITFELERLRVTLRNRGLDARTIETIVNKAGREISEAFKVQGDAAMQRAIEAGVEQRSPEFINELILDPSRMELITESGNTEFTEPPYPMLSKLLQNAKPIKDGSGVYKIIPVGLASKDRPKVSTNIYDAMKKVNAERAEAARKQYSAIIPGGSKATEFRTATSKQDANAKWVKPGRTKDFSEEVRSINRELESTMDEKVRDILQSYMESF
jgi:hypothetical protein